MSNHGGVRTPAAPAPRWVVRLGRNESLRDPEQVRTSYRREVCLFAHTVPFPGKGCPKL